MITLTEAELEALERVSPEAVQAYTLYVKQKAEELELNAIRVSHTDLRMTLAGFPFVHPRNLRWHSHRKVQRFIRELVDVGLLECVEKRFNPVYRLCWAWNPHVPLDGVPDPHRRDA